MPREKSKYRDRRLSSSSSEASHDRKKKSKYKRRSRSRDRSESSHKSKQSSSRSKHKRRSYSRSLSRDRYESKSRRRSSSRTRSRRDRSRSKSRTKYKSKKTSKRSRSRSRSSSYEIEPGQPRKIIDDTESKVEKAIKAANAVGLTLTKIPTYEYKTKEVKEEMPTIHDRNLLNELDNDSFVQRTFTSSRNKKQNIVIDLNSDTVKVPDGDVKVKKEDGIIDFNEIPIEEELKEMWIKKLYQYRKKMLKGEI